MGRGCWVLSFLPLLACGGPSDVSDGGDVDAGKGDATVLPDGGGDAAPGNDCGAPTYVASGARGSDNPAYANGATYDYSPSVMLDGVYRMWWCCGSTSGGVAGDHICYAEATLARRAVARARLGGGELARRGLPRHRQRERLRRHAHVRSVRPPRGGRDLLHVLRRHLRGHDADVDAHRRRDESRTASLGHD